MVWFWIQILLNAYIYIYIYIYILTINLLIDALILKCVLKSYLQNIITGIGVVIWGLTTDCLGGIFVFYSISFTLFLTKLADLYFINSSFFHAIINIRFFFYYNSNVLFCSFSSCLFFSFFPLLFEKKKK